MLDTLKRLFEQKIRSSHAASDERDHDLRLATAALLFEVVRADGTIDPEERAAMRAAMESTFDLPPAEMDEVLRLAEEASRRAVSLYEFTQVVDTAFSQEEKNRIVELLWRVAFADARNHALEEHLIRTVSGLLHVLHADFIDAKRRARGVE